MANVFTFYFKGIDVQTLAQNAPDYILVSAEIVTKTIDGVDVGVIVVQASSFKKGTNTPLNTAGGCPVPPCVPLKSLADSDCTTKADNLIMSYINNNLF
jgi:hypothetical protein